MLSIDDIQFDKRSVESFEKNCLHCENKSECHEFLDENCQIVYLRHRVKMAVQGKEK